MSWFNTFTQIGESKICKKARKFGKLFWFLRQASYTAILKMSMSSRELSKIRSLILYHFSSIHLMKEFTL